jgi:hypothetical protein
MLAAEREGAFDPRVVDAFLAGWERFVVLRDQVTQRRLGFGDLVRMPENAWKF